jgi:hypothetical protein
MEPLSWLTVISLVEKVGLPVALWMIRKYQAGNAVQPEEIDELEAMAKTTPEDLAKKIITALGVSLDDPKAISILEKVGKTPPV